jgi:hypothetical protein
MGIITNKEYSVFEKECLKSFESLCVFGYREYYKNLLCILVEFYYRISGKKTTIPGPMMEIFDLFNQPLINRMTRRGKIDPVPKLMMEIFGLFNPQLVNHMIRQSKFKKQVLPHSYRLVTNRSELIVSYTDTHPVQFDLCTLPCADTFIDKRVSGWNENNKAEYFSVTSTDQGGTQSKKNNI